MARTAPNIPRLAALLALSGAAALTCEVVWMRRLALALGSTGAALTLTLALYMAGLGLGGALAGQRRWARAPRGYGLLELAAACWAVLFPTTLALCQPLFDAGHGWLAAGVLLVPIGALHGATLPAVSAALPTPADAARLYAANTAGAVLGVLVGTFVLMPALGIRGTELVAAAAAATAGLVALSMAHDLRFSPPPTHVIDNAPPDRPALVAASIAGAVAMALEICWSRLGTLLLGGSVYAMAMVLAVFLSGIAFGAWLGRRWGRRGLTPALAALGVLALLGTAAWRAAPHGVAMAWGWFGEAGLLPAGALIMATVMAGAPVASGIVFTAALSADRGRPAAAAGRVLAANTVGSVIGAGVAGLWALPTLGVRGTVVVAAALSATAAAALSPRRGPRRFAGPAAVLALILITPRWDPALFSVGLGLRVSEFADLSPRAVERFAHEGWELLSYEDGVSASVAVGRSAKTGNIWLSINGKVDASTGDDMPTQLLSGELPVRIAASTGPVGPVAVVGLASGVTARAALDAGAAHVDIIELEPAVVRASLAFREVNGDLHTEPRATVHVADARSWLAQPGPPFDVIISEPSNPWITGVSNLFTAEYWRLGHARLRPGGVFCQWVQLYALPPKALRSLVRTFLDEFGQAWLFETIPGADALLIAAPALPPDLPMQPTLGPAQLEKLAGNAPRNTDDHPWVEFEAPKWLHRSTGAENRALIEDAAL